MTDIYKYIYICTHNGSRTGARHQMKNLQIGDTYTTTTGSQVTVRRAVTKNMFIVSYGFNSRGKDVTGMIHTSLIK